MKDRNIEGQDDKLLLQHYLIVFLDILGQRSGLREITTLPTNETEKHEFIVKLQGTIGKVDAVRRAFRDFFNAAELHTPNTSLVPAEHREEFIAS